MNWNELLKKYFVETLEFVKSSAPEFKNQASLYIEELIKWEIIYNSILCVMFIIPCLLMTYIIYRAWSSDDINRDDKFGTVARRYFKDKQGEG